MHKILIFLALISLSASAQESERKLHFGAFDSITLYQPSSGPIEHVALFISGDGGWNLDVISIAKELLSLHTLVVGVDIRNYFKNIQLGNPKCFYPAADFEMLSKFVQKTEKFPAYILPVLIGYSSGATLAYTIIAQSPANTFKGALSMGFSPNLLITKTLCAGPGGLTFKPGPRGKGFTFLPRKNLPTPWVVFQGKSDRVCNERVAQKFVEQIPSAKIVSLEKVGHGFFVLKNWAPQFKTTFTALAQIAIQTRLDSSAVSDLPLVEIPTQGSAHKDLLAIILSGDGGWAGIDKEIADELSNHGISVVGLNSLQYFWNARTPEGTTRDIERIMRHYKGLWNKSKVILIGYSFGADVLPFIAANISGADSRAIDLFAFLGLGEKADFQFHASGWFTGYSEEALPVIPEFAKLKGKKLLYFYGAEEKENLVDKLDKSSIKIISLQGGHHFGGHFDAIADTIIAACSSPLTPVGSTEENRIKTVETK